MCAPRSQLFVNAVSAVRKFQYKKKNKNVCECLYQFHTHRCDESKPISRL